MNEQVKKDALAFCREHITAVIATSLDNDPRASTVYFYIDNAFNFYFTTKRNSSKYLNLELNPRVAIVVGTGPEPTTIQAYGIATLVPDAEIESIKKLFFDTFAQEHVKTWPIEEMENFKDRHRVWFKITPTKMFFMNLDSIKYPQSVSNEYIEIEA